MNKFTPWFPGSVKPVRIGVYERRHVPDEGDYAVNGYSYWNGDNWMTSQSEPKITYARSLYQPHENGGHDFKWRGLTEPQGGGK